MSKLILGFLATPFVIFGVLLFALGLLIRYGLQFTTDYIEIMSETLTELKDAYEDEE